jgi:phosphatidylglycerophosphate synthase
LDKRLARALVRPLARTPIHPSHLTALGLVAGLAAAGLFATGSAAAAHWAAGLFMLYLFLDHTDGELARLTGKITDFGGRFDFVVGGVNFTALFIGIGIGLHAQGLGVWALVLGLAAGLANPAITALRMTTRYRFGYAAIAHPGRGGVEMDDAVYLIGPFTWLGGIEYFLLAFGLGTLGYLGWTLLKFLRQSAPPADRAISSSGSEE